MKGENIPLVAKWTKRTDGRGSKKIKIGNAMLTDKKNTLYFYISSN